MDNMDFKDFLQEEQEKHAVFAFGRFNPPTTGHEKLVQKVHDVAKANKASHVVVASHSQDAKKNPLSPETKVKHLQRFFPKTNIETSSKERPNFLEQAAKLHKEGATHLHMVAGSDRAEEYHRLLHKYNGSGEGKLFNFKHIKVHSSGERDPDAEGAEGMSASKMREHASSGNFKEFKKGIPSHVKPEHAKELYNDVRHGMAIKEEAVRERYVDGQIFWLGETVYTREGSGEVVFRGPNYVTVKLDEGHVSKKWLSDLSETAWAEPKVPSFVEAKMATSKLPALLLSRDRLAKIYESASQISYNGYTTENFEMCPSAKQHFAELIKRNDVNPEYVMKALQATDSFLAVEKQAKADGFADQQMVHDFVMYLSIAHDTLNALGYADRDINYMKTHLDAMSKLSMHRDGSFANEFGTHTPVIGTSEVSEETKEQTSQKVEITDVDGKKTTKNLKAKSVIKSGDNMKESKTFKSFRGSFSEAADVQTDDVAQGETEHRDVNSSPDKDVFAGIHKPEAGMFSFADFVKHPGKADAAAATQKDVDDVHQAQVTNFGNPSQHYNQMRKAHQQQG